MPKPTFKKPDSYQHLTDSQWKNYLELLANLVEIEYQYIKSKDDETSRSLY